jgi:hypothetical protein
MPERGNPDAIALAKMRMSGVTGNCSKAKYFPVLPNPVWISSKIKRIPYLSQIFLRPSMNGLGGIT